MSFLRGWKMFEAIALPQSSTIASRRFAAIALNTCAQWVSFRCSTLEDAGSNEEVQAGLLAFWHHVQDVPIFSPDSWQAIGVLTSLRWGSPVANF